MNASRPDPSFRAPQLLPPPPRRMGARSRWPAFVVLLLLGHVTLMFFAVRAATTDGSLIVEPDYYQKAVAWDDQRSRQRESDALGWTLAVSAMPEGDAVDVAAIPGHGRLMQFELRDRNGAAVSVDGLEIRACHRTRPSEVQAVRAVRTETMTPGIYAARLSIDREGFWTFEVSADQGRFFERREMFLFAGETLSGRTTGRTDGKSLEREGLQTPSHSEEGQVSR